MYASQLLLYSFRKLTDLTGRQIFTDFGEMAEATTTPVICALFLTLQGSKNKT